jgi:hypothetical protein
MMNAALDTADKPEVRHLVAHPVLSDKVLTAQERDYFIVRNNVKVLAA